MDSLCTIKHCTLIGRQGMGVDLENVLYTDVDTIFMGDMNACSLPAPRILAAAGEVTMLTPANAGVLHINLTAWQELHGDLMRFAGLHNWTFPNADQEWLFSFFGDRVSVLPDTYNWKPYWCGARVPGLSPSRLRSLGSSAGYRASSLPDICIW